MLFNSKSINQALVRYKYLKFFTEQESKIVHSIKKELVEIAQLKDELNKTLDRQKNTLRMKEQEEEKYLASRDNKNILLHKLKWNQKNLSAKLKEEGIQATVRIVKGDAAHEILEYASQNNIDLIIMTTHGSSAMVRWFLGSVADKVLRHSSSAVLLVSPHGTRDNR